MQMVRYQDCTTEVQLVGSPAILFDLKAFVPAHRKTAGHGISAWSVPQLTGVVQGKMFHENVRECMTMHRVCQGKHGHTLGMFNRNVRECMAMHKVCHGMHDHAQGMFKGNIRECMAMHRECSWGMSENAWSCTGNVQGECQGMHGHAQGILKGNVRECKAMHRECSWGMSGNA